MVVLGRVRFLMGEVPLYRAGDYAADWREDRLLLRRDWHGRHYRGGMRPTLVDVRCLPVLRCSRNLHTLSTATQLGRGSTFALRPLALDVCLGEQRSWRGLARWGPGLLTTKGPMRGHPMLVLGALCSFLEPFCGHLSPKNDKVSEELTLRYPHEGP